MYSPQYLMCTMQERLSRYSATLTEVIVPVEDVTNDGYLMINLRMLGVSEGGLVIALYNDVTSDERIEELAGLLGPQLLQELINLGIFSDNQLHCASLRTILETGKQIIRIERVGYAQDLLWDVEKLKFIVEYA